MGESKSSPALGYLLLPRPKDPAVHPRYSLAGKPAGFAAVPCSGGATRRGKKEHHEEMDSSRVSLGWSSRETGIWDEWPCGSQRTPSLGQDGVDRDLKGLPCATRGEVAQGEHRLLHPAAERGNTSGSKHLRFQTPPVPELAALLKASGDGRRP